MAKTNLKKTAKTLTLGMLIAGKMLVGNHAAAHAEPTQKDQPEPETRPGVVEQYPFSVTKTGKLILRLGSDGTYEIQQGPAEGAESHFEFGRSNTPFANLDGKPETVNVFQITHRASARLPAGLTGHFQVSTMRPSTYAPNSPSRARTSVEIHAMLGGGAYRPNPNAESGITSLTLGLGGRDLGAYAQRARGKESYWQLGIHTPGTKKEESGEEKRRFAIHQIYAALRQYDPEYGEEESEGNKAARQSRIILGVEAGNEDARGALETHIDIRTRRVTPYAQISVPFWTGPHASPEIREPETPGSRRSEKRLAKPEPARRKPAFSRRMMER